MQVAVLYSTFQRLRGLKQKGRAAQPLTSDLTALDGLALLLWRNSFSKLLQNICVISSRDY